MKTKKRKSRLTVDPGISGTGYAVWSLKWKLLETGALHESRAKNWEDKGKAIAVGLYKVSQKFNVTRVYIEFPQYMQSAGGQVTARSGSLVKLCWMVGFISAVFMDKIIRLVGVNEWKGNLPKDVTEKRVRRLLPGLPKKMKSHAVDALGIGLFLQGRM